MNFEGRIDSSSGLGGNPLIEDPEADRKARRRLILIAVGVLVLMVAVWFGVHRRNAAAADAAPKDQAPLVSVVAPGRTTIEGAINATGTLAARRELPVGVAGEGGQIAAVLVEPGQWVHAGQVLAVIDRSVQAQQESSQAAQIEVARANAQLAEDNYQRALKLVDRGFVSKADVDRLRATRDAAVAQTRVAGAQLGVLRAQTHRLNIVAPASGLVLERRVEPGQVVSAGSGVLFRMAKDGEMELKALVGELDLAQLSQGVSADVTPVGATHSFPGQVWQVSPVIDPQTRQGTAQIALAYAPELRPGGFASAVIKAGTVNAPLLPQSAVLSDNKGSYVYIVGAGNKIERRDVKTGLVTDTGVAVIGGLAGNERVVARSGAFLSVGEVIRPTLGNQ